MILKIERYVEDKRWYMLDNIAKVGVSEVRKYRANGLSEWGEEYADIFLLDMTLRKEQVTGCNCHEKDECNSCVFIDYIQLICRLNNGEEFAVVFDTICYVLNDNGKTIEKIVANFNE